MRTVFSAQLRRMVVGILTWGALLALLGFVIVSLYGDVKSQKDNFEAILDGLPTELLTVVGNPDALFSPAGYLDSKYFLFLPLFLGVWMLLLGSGLVATDEEDGILDLLLAQPISRARLLTGRLAALAVAGMLVLAMAGLGLWLGMTVFPMGIDAWKVVLPLLSLGAYLAWFAAFALFLSQVSPSRRGAAGFGALVLAAGFFAVLLGPLVPALASAAAWFPLSDFQGAKAVDAFDWLPFSRLLGESAVFVGLSFWQFQVKDIRVVGEGGWRWKWR